MTTNFPNPGSGYKIREYLGGGNWKTAYRASTPFRLNDVALLYFRDENDTGPFLKDSYNLLRTGSGRHYCEYLAEFYGLNRGADGRFFIVEELLARPLDGMSPLNDLSQFVRIARDLCRGLTCLHEANLIHRDLKLDNCGIDHQQKAKIFDLGSVTSDGGQIRGSVLTRAPELFEVNAQCSFATDVWALGATLFALRSGEYPFVYKSEVKERQIINSEMKAGSLDRAEAQGKKDELDKAVAARIKRFDALGSLRDRIHSVLRGRSEEILLGMLDFSIAQRKRIKDCDSAWSELAQELAGSSGSAHDTRNKWEKIRVHLKLVEQKEFILTRKQIERIVVEYQAEHPPDADGEINTLLGKIKENLA